LENVKGRDDLGYLGMDEKIILDWIIRETGWEGAY
jgi:hypothetical protein